MFLPQVCLCLHLGYHKTSRAQSVSKTTNSVSSKCHTVLIVIRSLLDNEPYKHEPGQKDHPEFNAFVQYTTWKCLLLDYLERETEPAAKTWLQKYIRQNGQDMLSDLARQHRENAKKRLFSCPYKSAPVLSDYPNLIKALQTLVSKYQPRPIEETRPRPSPLVVGPSCPETATLKRKCEPEADDVACSQTRVHTQKDDMMPGDAVREPEKKRRVKEIEVIDLT